MPNSYCGTQKTEFGMKNASMALCVTVSRSVMARLFETPRTGSCQAPLSMEFSRQVDCHFLLQGIFPAQGSNRGLLHCRQILYHLSHQGSPSGSLKTGSKNMSFLCSEVTVLTVVYKPFSSSSSPTSLPLTVPQTHHEPLSLLPAIQGSL